MIYAKLLQFQKNGISVKKDASNPYFNSRYVTLNEVLEKIKKPLNELGILIVQSPQEKGLLTELIDTEDNSKVTSFMSYVEATTAQKMGSNNTYNRRYSLVTLLGLEDEDDDGNVASALVKKWTPRKPNPMAKIQLQKEGVDLDYKPGYDDGEPPRNWEQMK